MILVRRFFLLAVLFGLGPGPIAFATPAQDPANSGAAAVSLLNAHCVGCHGPAQQLSGLRLDVRASVLEGGYSGPSITPGDSLGSPLVKRLISDQEGF